MGVLQHHSQGSHHYSQRVFCINRGNVTGKICLCLTVPKALVALIILVLFLRAQEQIRPYRLKVFNEIEQREMITSVLLPFPSQ